MGRKVKLTLLPLQKEIWVSAGTPLTDILHEYGIEFPCGGKGTCGSCKVKLLSGEIDRSEKHADHLNRLQLDNTWRLACESTIKEDITLEVKQFEHIILADDSDFSFTPENGYGIAVDLGTTTMVAQLIRMKDGAVMDSVSQINPQGRFGADLITRIQAGIEGAQEEMCSLVRQTIGQMGKSMAEKHRLDVKRVTLVGNTLMHHLFCGLPITPLGFYPFLSDNLQKRHFTSSDLEWEIPGNPEIVFQPAIGSFVGSDILAGIAATGILNHTEYNILIDLGTNGEIVAGNSNGALCASTAAGPAFEGAKISQGMRASTGAISSVEWREGNFHSHVIGNIEAKGICGSGLIDVMAILLEQQQIGLMGEILSGEERLEITPGVYLTQEDIREFQLAKAALSSGVKILIDQLGITPEKIDKVYIAGGFGHFLNPQHLFRTGLLEFPENKIVKMGNTALTGAKMFLFDDSIIPGMMEHITHINLEGHPGFQDIYVDKMLFE